VGLEDQDSHKVIAAVNNKKDEEENDLQGRNL
jgi:hypothetical protein